MESVIIIFVENLAFSVILTTWIVTRLFVMCLIQESDMKWDEIFRVYKVLREFIGLMNKAFSPWMVAYLASAILLLSMSLQSTMRLRFKNVAHSVLIMCTQIVVAGGLILAADVQNQVSLWKTWLAKYRLLVPEREYHTVTNELVWNLIGIRGGGNMLTITYGVLWNVGDA